MVVLWRRLCASNIGVKLTVTLSGRVFMETFGTHSHDHVSFLILDNTHERGKEHTTRECSRLRTREIPFHTGVLREGHGTGDKALYRVKLNATERREHTYICKSKAVHAKRVRRAGSEYPRWIGERKER